MAEKLGFKQSVRNGRAVDHNERFIPEGAIVVNGLGHQFFAGAALSLNQNVGSGIGYQPDHLKDFPHLRRASDDVVYLIFFLLLLQ